MQVDLNIMYEYRYLKGSRFMCVRLLPLAEAMSCSKTRQSRMI